jgi:hypothetical protein
VSGKVARFAALRVGLFHIPHAERCCCDLRLKNKTASLVWSTSEAVKIEEKGKQKERKISGLAAAAFSRLFALWCASRAFGIRNVRGLSRFGRLRFKPLHTRNNNDYP